MSKKVKSPKGVSHVTVTIGGKRRRLRYCVRSVTLAAEQGYDYLDLFPPTELDDAGKPVLDEKGEPKVAKLTTSEAIKYQVRLLWFGLLPYEPELTLEELEFDFEFGELQAAADDAEKAFRRFMPDFFPKNGESATEDTAGESERSEPTLESSPPS